MIFTQKLDPDGAPLEGFLDSAFGSIKTAFSSATDAISSAANSVCGVVNNPTVQGGLALLPGSVGTTSAGICSALGKGGKTGAGAAPAPAPGAAPAPAPVAYPAGSIAMRTPFGTFAIAVPKRRAGGLFGPDLHCINGDCAPEDIYDLQGKREEAFDATYARLTHSGYGYQENVYRTARGLAGAGTHEVVTDQATSAGNAAIVSAAMFKDKTTPPFYKTWWFWSAVGGAALATGVAVYVVRRRRKG